MLKKILIVLFICLETFAIQAPPVDDYKNFKKSLMLNPWQSYIIEKIETQTREKNRIHYQNLRKNHKEIVKCNNNFEKTCSQRLSELRIEQKKLEKKIYKNLQIQDELIIEILYPWQKNKFKEYRSRIY